jgi:hypothetical protein
MEWVGLNWQTLFAFAPPLMVAGRLWYIAEDTRRQVIEINGSHRKTREQVAGIEAVQVAKGCRQPGSLDNAEDNEDA